AVFILVFYLSDVSLYLFLFLFGASVYYMTAKRLLTAILLWIFVSGCIVEKETHTKHVFLTSTKSETGSTFTSITSILGLFVLVYYLPDVSIIHTIQTFLAVFILVFYLSDVSELYKIILIYLCLLRSVPFPLNSTCFWFAIISTLLLFVTA
ncbi:hypothetical protein ACJX0J_020000, partial [Zea mays]